ncbi:hypothetical protein CPC08DRAFT_329294 [Agrocybe pediades]|nr:hypothetical protein CPC08DRAFT_329294 [Agrocybe pediades]
MISFQPLHFFFRTFIVPKSGLFVMYTRYQVKRDMACSWRIESLFFFPFFIPHHHSLSAARHRDTLCILFNDLPPSTHLPPPLVPEASASAPPLPSALHPLPPHCHYPISSPESHFSPISMF